METTTHNLTCIIKSVTRKESVNKKAYAIVVGMDTEKDMAEQMFSVWKSEVTDEFEANTNSTIFKVTLEKKGDFFNYKKHEVIASGEQKVLEGTPAVHVQPKQKVLTQPERIMLAQAYNCAIHLSAGREGIEIPSLVDKAFRHYENLLKLEEMGLKHKYGEEQHDEEKPINGSENAVDGNTEEPIDLEKIQSEKDMEAIPEETIKA